MHERHVQPVTTADDLSNDNYGRKIYRPFRRNMLESQQLFKENHAEKWISFLTYEQFCWHRSLFISVQQCLCSQTVRSIVFCSTNLETRLFNFSFVNNCFKTHRIFTVFIRIKLLTKSLIKLCVQAHSDSSLRVTGKRDYVACCVLASEQQIEIIFYKRLWNLSIFMIVW